MAALVILILLGVLVLWLLFSSKSSVKVNKTVSGADKDREAQKVQELIKRLEKENPELVSKIRSRFIADKKLESVKESGQDEISNVVKHWMSEK
ncbi:hypothetical protein [Pelotomaculum propionicicum]|uniref:hypothetical protein n=1 Tax=Pelotomaculum propionicicum TaxID=258475 RepID=UPI003BA19F7C